VLGFLLVLLDEALDDFALDLGDGTGGKSSLAVRGCGFWGVDLDLLRGSCRDDSEPRPNVVLDSDVLTPDRSCRDVAVATPVLAGGVGSAAVCLLLLQQLPIGATERLSERSSRHMDSPIYRRADTSHEASCKSEGMYFMCFQALT
jgi:hypothetical protein